MRTRLVTVKWQDATVYTKCLTKAKCDRTLELEGVVTTGYLVEEYDDFLAIAQSYDESDAYWDILCIPWGMVDEWFDT